MYVFIYEFEHRTVSISVGHATDRASTPSIEHINNMTKSILIGLQFYRLIFGIISRGPLFSFQYDLVHLNSGQCQINGNIKVTLNVRRVDNSFVPETCGF